MNKLQILLEWKWQKLRILMEQSSTILKIRQSWDLWDVLLDGFAVGMLAVLHENATIKSNRGWQRWHCLSSALVCSDRVWHVAMAEAKAPAKGMTRGGGIPNQQAEGRNKRRRRHLRGRRRPSGDPRTNWKRGAPQCNKMRQCRVEAQLEGEGGQCAGQHDNQPNKGGAMVQQEVAALGGGATRGGGRPEHRQRDTTTDQIIWLQQEADSWWEGKQGQGTGQHDNQQRTRGGGTG